MMERQGLFYYDRNISKKRGSFYKSVHSHFISGVKDGRISAAQPPGLAGQSQAGGNA